MNPHETSDSVTVVPRVLVVDDEPLVRRAIARELLGYDVVEACSAEEAASALDGAADLAAVFSDLDLGLGGSGLEVLSMTRSRAPRTLRFLLSGHASAEDVAEEVGSGVIDVFFAKPWMPGELRAALTRTASSGRMRTKDGMGGSAARVGVEPTSEELLERARGGDSDSCELLLRRYLPLCEAIIRREHRIPEDDVEDVVQTVRLRLFRHIGRVRRPGSFLAQVATTACLEHHRRVRRERAAFRELALLHAGRRDGFRGVEKSLIDRLDVGETLTRVGRRCAKLLSAMMMGIATQKEYAEEHGIPLGTVGPTVVRCLRKMRVVLTGGRRRPEGTT